MDNYDISELDILVVDDNASMLRMLCGMLRALGASNVREAANGADAFEMNRGQEANLIICDWNMKPVNGIQLTQMLRNDTDTPNPYVPVILVTGFTDRERVMSARDSGIHEFLAKPASARSLYARICQTIECPRPFIRTPDYFGPDRRRRPDPSYDGSERRAADTADRKI
jgi:CheY-like chemotaxis protein